MDLEPVQQVDLEVDQQVAQTSRSGGRPEQAMGRRRKGKAAATSVMPAEMCAYEQMREDNIREREALFESLNLAESVNSCKEGLPAKSSRQRGT